MKEDDLHRFIKKKPYLVWHVRDLNRLSEDAILEAVLNYGNFSDVQDVIDILGIEQAAYIFRKQTQGEKRCNYSAKTKNYFNRYFDKYA